MRAPLSRALVAVLAGLVMATPAFRRWLEASMTLQMLVQMPLLAIAGWWLASLVPLCIRNRLARFDAGGVTGLVLASAVSLPWMLPRAMDAAVDVPWVAFAKFASLPLLVGLPFALSWPRMGFVVRGVFFAEAIAMCFRLGWLYLASPERLCANYLIGDQQRLGRWLLVIGVAVFLSLMALLIAGRFEAAANRHTPAPPARRAHPRQD